MNMDDKPFHGQIESKHEPIFANEVRQERHSLVNQCQELTGVDGISGKYSVL